MEQDYLEQTRHKHIDLVVCSDGEAILGIGDQGVGVRASNFVSAMFILIKGCSGNWHIHGKASGVHVRCCHLVQCLTVA